MATQTGYQKFPSTGIDKRTQTLAIKLTQSEQEAAQKLAAAQNLSCSAFWGLIVIKLCEEKGQLPEGYSDQIQKDL